MTNVVETNDIYSEAIAYLIRASTVSVHTVQVADEDSASVHLWHSIHSEQGACRRTDPTFSVTYFQQLQFLSMAFDQSVMRRFQVCVTLIQLQKTSIDIRDSGSSDRPLPDATHPDDHGSVEWVWERAAVDAL